MLQVLMGAWIALAAHAAAQATPAEHEGRALIRRFIEDDRTIPASIDPVQGLLVLRYEDAGPPEVRASETRTQELLCGASIARKRGQVRRLLGLALGRAPLETWQCEGMACTAPGRRFEPTTHLTFARGVDGALVLNEIATRSEHDVSETWAAEAATFLTRARSARQPCAALRPRASP